MFYPTCQPEKGIINKGLYLFIDAGIKGSYPGSGTQVACLALSLYTTGVFFGNTVYSQDKSGGFIFDGYNSAILFGNNIVNSVIGGVASQFTISTWLKTNPILESDLSKVETFFGKHGNTTIHGSPQSQFLIRLYAPSAAIDKYRFECVAYFNLNGSEYKRFFSNTTGIKQNTIYNVVLTYDGTKYDDTRMAFYINGGLEAMLEAPGIGNWGDIPYGTAQFSLGGSYGTSGPLIEDWNGSIYQVMVYDRILSTAEIVQNFNATRGRFGV